MSQASQDITQQFINGGVVPEQLNGQSVVSKKYVDDQDAIRDGKIAAVASGNASTAGILNNHIASTNAHSAQDITYGGEVTGATNVKQAIDIEKRRTDTIVAQSGTDITEIVDARGGYPVLSARLDASVKVFKSAAIPTPSEIVAMKDGDLFIVYGDVYASPTVVTTIPANGTKIQTSSRPKIVVTFSVKMNADTTSAFKLYPTLADRNAGTNAIAGTVTQSGDGSRWTFIPASDLTYLNAYYPRIGTSAQSSGGLMMEQDYEFNFICGKGAFTIKPIIGYLYDSGVGFQWGGFMMSLSKDDGSDATNLGFGLDIIGGAPVYARNSSFTNATPVDLGVARTTGWHKWEFRPETGELFLDGSLVYTHPDARRVKDVYLATNNTDPNYFDDVTTEDFVDTFENGLDTARWGNLGGAITATVETTIKHSGAASAKLVGAAGFNYRSYIFTAK